MHATYLLLLDTVGAFLQRPAVHHPKPLYPRAGVAEPRFLPQGCPWHRPSSRAFTARLPHPCKSPPLRSRSPQPPSQQAHSSLLSAGTPDGRAPYAFCIKREVIRKMSEWSKAKAWL